jgi:hypothetical protein
MGGFTVRPAMYFRQDMYFWDFAAHVGGPGSPQKLDRGLENIDNLRFASVGWPSG